MKVPKVEVFSVAGTPSVRVDGCPVTTLEPFFYPKHGNGPRKRKLSTSTLCEIERAMNAVLAFVTKG